MTKQEAIDKAWAMLEMLEAMPDGVDILNAEVREYSGPAGFRFHLNGGIEPVRKSMGLPVSAHTPDGSEYIHRKIKVKNCEYCQLDENAAPGVGSTGGGKAEQGPTQDTPIINHTKGESQTVKMALQGTTLRIKDADNVQFTVIKSWNKMRWVKKL